MTSKFFVLSCLLTFTNADMYQPYKFVRIPSHKFIFGLGTPSLESRIVGGQDAKEGEFPHQVSVQIMSLDKFWHYCGGSIIHEKWILTAAHCTIIPGPIMIKAGKHRLNVTEPNEQAILVENFYIHEKYDKHPNVSPYDIALLKLSDSLKLNNRVAKIKLPKAHSEPLGDVVVSGWGSISTTVEPEEPIVLQKVIVPILNRKACNESILGREKVSRLHETNICTESVDIGHGTCKGDSGGPLIKITGNYSELDGIVSWGYLPCTINGAPSVYVKVSDFVDWIATTIAENS